MAKRPKQGKKTPEQQDNQKDKPENKNDLSGKFLDTVKDALTEFSQMSEEDRLMQYGDQEFIDQFWEYFTKHQPGLLDDVKKEDLPKYIALLEKK